MPETINSHPKIIIIGISRKNFIAAMPKINKANAVRIYASNVLSFAKIVRNLSKSLISTPPYLFCSILMNQQSLYYQILLFCRIEPLTISNPLIVPWQDSNQLPDYYCPNSLAPWI